MAKKSVGGGVFGGDPSSRMSNVLAGDRLGGRKYGNLSMVTRNSPYQKEKPFGFTAKVPKDQSRVARGIPKATGEERISSPQKKVGLVGGLGMQAYNSPGYGSYRVNPLSSTENRNYQYGNVLAPAANKKAASSVVRATTTEKLSPVKAQPKAPTRMGNRMAMLEKNVAGPRKTAAGKNVSYGFASMKDMARSAGKSIGGMAGGMRSGGGRATDPSRGGMGYSGRGTGSKK